MAIVSALFLSLLLLAGFQNYGQVVIVDFYNKRMDVGPPPSHTLAKEVVLEEMKSAGYQLLEDKAFLPY